MKESACPFLRHRGDTKGGGSDDKRQPTNDAPPSAEQRPAAASSSDAVPPPEWTSSSVPSPSPSPGPAAQAQGPAAAAAVPSYTVYEQPSPSLVPSAAPYVHPPPPPPWMEPTPSPGFPYPPMHPTQQQGEMQGGPHHQQQQQQQQQQQPPGFFLRDVLKVVAEAAAVIEGLRLMLMTLTQWFREVSGFGAGVAERGFLMRYLLGWLGLLVGGRRAKGRGTGRGGLTRAWEESVGVWGGGGGGGPASRRQYRWSVTASVSSSIYVALGLYLLFRLYRQWKAYQRLRRWLTAHTRRPHHHQQQGRPALPPVAEHQQYSSPPLHPLLSSPEARKLLPRVHISQTSSTVSHSSSGATASPRHIGEGVGTDGSPISDTHRLLWEMYKRKQREAAMARRGREQHQQHDGDGDGGEPSAFS